jgi:hypothetical protein
MKPSKFPPKAFRSNSPNENVPVRNFLAGRERRAAAEELGAVVDRSVAVAVHGEKRNAGTGRRPVRLFGDAVRVEVEAHGPVGEREVLVLEIEQDRARAAAPRAVSRDRPGLR